MNEILRSRFYSEVRIGEHTALALRGTLKHQGRLQCTCVCVCALAGQDTEGTQKGHDVHDTGVLRTQTVCTHTDAKHSVAVRKS